MPNYPRLGSKMEVLLNESLFCMQLGGGGCLDDGTGHPFNASWNEQQVRLCVRERVSISVGCRAASVRR